MRSIIFVLVAALLFSACRKKPDPVSTPQVIDNGGVELPDGHLKIAFENVVGSQQLVLNTGVYQNEAAESFSLKMYKYYISNIKLWRADSSFYAEPESYHLINEEQAVSKSFTLHDVPPASYVAISFTIGVDSLRNTTGAQTGALDPANAMYWDWNTGYIMAKLEGTSPQSAALGQAIIYHTGGFSGVDNVLKTVKLPFPAAAVVNGSKTPQVHIKSDVLEWFRTPTPISFMEHYNITNPGRTALMIANNYADMFVVDHVEN